MIDNAGISPARIVTPRLRVVRKVTRLRDQIDRRQKYFFAKRIFDIVCSLVFIVCILSWLLPLLCLLIRLTSKGPAFFIQNRIGRGGKTFRCYKLRTMVSNAEADILPALEKDNRVTMLGSFLRRSNIDEFPQFFNILKGDMSLVGPRPHMYADCRKFSRLIPRYKTRNLVRPGLTGLAQTKGYHGPATTSDSIRMRFLWDTYYINHANFAMDIRIVFYTVIRKCTRGKKRMQDMLDVKPGIQNI